MRRTLNNRLIAIVVLFTIHYSLFTSFAVAQDTAKRYDYFFLEAICQQEKGCHDAAFDLLTHCVEIDSTRSEAYYYLARYYDFLKNKDKALAYSEKAVQLEPDNVTYLETLANTYIGRRQYDKAIDAMEHIYSKNSEREDVLSLLVQLYEQQQDYEGAIRTLTRLETMEGKSERLSMAKSELYTRKGDKKAAINEMKQLADQYPNDQNYRCLYGTTLYLNGQQKKAVAIYNDILKIEPDNRSAQMALLSHYNEIGDSVQARQWLDRMLMNKNATTQDRVLLLRQVIGESERNGGDSTQVLRLFHRVLNLPQADADLAIFCATYMNLKKMPNDSISPILERALALEPANAAARLQNPDEMAFYYYQGIAYFQKDQLDQALNAFQNGIGVITAQSDPAIVSDFYAVMGDILHQKGQAREAFVAYDSCLVWKEDNIGCLNNYAYYLSELGEQLDKAEQMSYRTIKAEPKNSTYLDTYAWILFMQKRYSEAKIYIDQTLQYDTDTSAVLLEHAGDIYYQAGDAAQALEYWRQALEQAEKDDDTKNDRRPILIRKIKLKKYLKE